MSGTRLHELKQLIPISVDMHEPHAHVLRSYDCVAIATLPEMHNFPHSHLSWVEFKYSSCDVLRLGHLLEVLGMI